MLFRSTSVCKTLSQKGFDIVFTYFKGKDRATRLEEEIGDQGRFARGLQLDLNCIENIQQVVEQANKTLNGIDSLVISSGIAAGNSTENDTTVPDYFDITPDIYNTMMQVNVRGVFFVIQEVARIMSISRKGRIVIVGSIDGIKLLPSPVDYACCKAALWGITQSLAKELGKHNILVNMVAPGILEDGIAELLSDKLMQEYLKHCSLKRVGTFTEIASMIAFLAGEKNTYLTGQAVVLDGGL